MTLNHYSDVKAYLTTILTNNGQLSDTQHSPHQVFWDALSYIEFTTGNVPGIKDPISGSPMPILIKNNAEQSNLIKALRGTTGSVFDPNTGAFGQMPADGPPFFSPAQIAPIVDWINNGCPE